MTAAENFKSKLMTYAVNVAPASRDTGASITHVSADMRFVRLKLPLHRKPKNPVGAMCGGDKYSAVHSIYLVMLMKSLGKDYACIDRLPITKFLKPGKGTLFTQFELTQAEIDEVKALIERNGRTDRQYLVELKDTNGAVCGEGTCTVKTRKKQAE
jgi:uncharacterized protein DUF4442